MFPPETLRVVRAYCDVTLGDAKPLAQAVSHRRCACQNLPHTIRESDAEVLRHQADQLGAPAHPIVADVADVGCFIIDGGMTRKTIYVE